MNEEKLIKAFKEGLNIDNVVILNALEYNSIKEWDSIGHMTLITAIETEFDIMIDTDDVIALNSFRKAKEIVQKYGVIF